MLKKTMRTYGMYEEELRQFNDAQKIRRGKNKNGYPPEGFVEVFEYSQPRRNSRGCGDLKIINRNTGEVTKIAADQVTTKFQHYRGPAGGRYAGKNARRDLADGRA
jgi:hypothetical protein